MEFSSAKQFPCCINIKWTHWLNYFALGGSRLDVQHYCCRQKQPTLYLCIIKTVNINSSNWQAKPFVKQFVTPSLSLSLFFFNSNGTWWKDVSWFSLNVPSTKTVRLLTVLVLESIRTTRRNGDGVGHCWWRDNIQGSAVLHRLEETMETMRFWRF